MFETVLVRPIFNLLMVLYALVGDFGIAIILFGVLVRFMMWPLLRKQLHQSRLMRQLQPKIKEIRKANKGDKQKEARLLMELYKQNGVNPMSSFGLLLVQMPVFIGLFSALRSFITSPERLIKMPYEWLRNNTVVQDIMSSVADKTATVVQNLSDSNLAQSVLDKLGGSVTVDTLHSLDKQSLADLYNTTLTTTDAEGVKQALVQGPFFDQHLFGIIDLSGRAIADGTVYLPVLIIAALAGVFQYMQTRQMVPKTDSRKTLRQIMKEAAASGKEPDQAEVSAIMSRKMGSIFAPFIFLIAATVPAGLALYFTTSGMIGYLQQRLVFSKDVKEMEELPLENSEDKTAEKPRRPKKKRKGRH